MSYQYGEMKILPFECERGEVDGHALSYAIIPGENSAKVFRMARSVECVIFDVFDSKAQVPVEVEVHLSHLTKYLKRTWPAGGSPVAVRWTDGSRSFASARYAGHSETSYTKAPLLARDCFRICDLGGNVLVEVVGVIQYLYSARRAEDAALIIDPWARDSAKFEKRMAALQSSTK